MDILKQGNIFIIQMVLQRNSEYKEFGITQYILTLVGHSISIPSGNYHILYIIIVIIPLAYFINKHQKHHNRNFK